MHIAYVVHTRPSLSLSKLRGTYNTKPLSFSVCVVCAVCVMMMEGNHYKKGLWTGEEDKILTDYVGIHGEGRWSRIAKTTSG